MTDAPEDNGQPMPVIRRAPGERPTPENTPAPVFDPPGTRAAVQPPARLAVAKPSDASE